MSGSLQKSNRSHIGIALAVNAVVRSGKCSAVGSTNTTLTGQWRCRNRLLAPIVETGESTRSTRADRNNSSRIGYYPVMLAESVHEQLLCDQIPGAYLTSASAARVQVLGDIKGEAFG